MKCQICNKKEASILFTQIVNDKKMVLNICHECAKEKGLSIEIVAATPASQKVEISKTAPVRKKTAEPIELVCNICGTSYAEFKKTGLFGCDKCITAFKVHVEELLKQIHGTSEHCGKTPKPPREADVLKQIKILRNNLKHSIEMEDYEQAAILRDKINDLQKGAESK